MNEDKIYGSTGQEPTGTTTNNELEAEPVNKLEIEPADFEPTAELRLLTSKNLSRAINSIFQGVFSDYAGCMIAEDPNATVGKNPGDPIFLDDLILTFEEQPENPRAIKSIKMLGEVETKAPNLTKLGMETFDARKQFAGRVLDLNDITKEILSPYVQTVKVGDKFKKKEWKNIIREVRNNKNGNPRRQKLTLCVVVSLAKVMKAMYGKYEMDGDIKRYVEYTVLKYGNLFTEQVINNINYTASVPYQVPQMAQQYTPYQPTATLPNGMPNPEVATGGYTGAPAQAAPLPPQGYPMGSNGMAIPPAPMIPGGDSRNSITIDNRRLLINPCTLGVLKLYSDDLENLTEAVFGSSSSCDLPITRVARSNK